MKIERIVEQIGGDLDYVKWVFDFYSFISNKN